MSRAFGADLPAEEEELIVFSSASELSLPPLATLVFTHACYQIVVGSTFSAV